MVTLAAIAAVYLALFTVGKYKPYEPTSINMAQDKGFIALSYFGVDCVGQQPLISEDRLVEHLAALHKQGYVTITQKDIKDFYEAGKPLSARALFRRLKTASDIGYFFNLTNRKVQL